MSKSTRTMTTMTANQQSFAQKHWESFSHEVYDYWDDFLDWLEDDDDMPAVVNWLSKNILRRVTVEAPVIIIFCFVCVVIHILQSTVLPGLNRFLAISDKLDMTSLMQIPRLFTHVIAHDGSLSHIKNNITHLLLVGPSAEHVYGSKAMLLVILLVAISSAFCHILVGSAYTHQLGASGVVFSVILLNSLVAAVSGKIPVSFLLTAGMWVTDEVYKFLFASDGVSHHAHLTGAVVGTVAGYYIHGGKSQFQKQVQPKKGAAGVKKEWWNSVMTTTGKKMKQR